MEPPASMPEGRRPMMALAVKLFPLPLTNLNSFNYHLFTKIVPKKLLYFFVTYP
jgi:hypothetical protein